MRQHMTMATKGNCKIPVKSDLGSTEKQSPSPGDPVRAVFLFDSPYVMSKGQTTPVYPEISTQWSWWGQSGGPASFVSSPSPSSLGCLSSTVGSLVQGAVADWPIGTKLAHPPITFNFKQRPNNSRIVQ